MTESQARYVRLIRSFRGRAIGVLGDFMLDELLRGEATRISPEAPVPVVLIENEQGAHSFPGGAGNVAANIAALGGRAFPFGAIGEDATGKQLRQLLECLGIACDTLVRENGRMTPRKVRVVAHQHQLLRLDFEKPSPLSPRAINALVRSFRRKARGLGALIISDYQKGSVTTELCAQVTAAARERKVPVFVDPKPSHPEICRDATCITPNLREAELLADASLKIYDLGQAAGTRLLERLGCGSALITRGAEGMTLIEAPTAKGSSPNVHEIPSVPRPVYDVTGAGDTVIAVLALAYASGASMREASELANLAAGRVVLKFGTAGVSSQELLEAVKGES